MDASDPEIPGKSIPGEEDYRFLTGSGQYIDDINAHARCTHSNTNA